MMDRRFFLALVLTAIVVFLTPVIFPSANQAARDSARARDSIATATAGSAPRSPITANAAVTTLPQTTPGAVATRPDSPAGAAPVSIRAETTIVETAKSRYRFSSIGAVPLVAELREFRKLRGATGVVELGRPGEPLLRYRLISPNDTVSLANVSFRLERSGEPSSPVLTYAADVAGRHVTIKYAFPNDTNYDIRVRTDIAGGTAAYLVTELPNGFHSFEADTVEDAANLAYVVKPTRAGAKGIPFAKLDPGEKRIEAGPVAWAAAKSKYFIVGILSPRDGKTTASFAEVDLGGAPRTSKVVSEGRAAVVIPINAGAAEFDVYAGPQEWKKLLAIGRGFEDANPYGGFFAGVVQPFATIVMRVLLWMKASTGLSYGWVLVIFGLVIRLALWPLNQSAMRNNMKLQRVQPELQAVQAKYKNDPAKLQTEMMLVYKAHGMSPFSTFSGCLPMLLPMPILFALFFVFRSTIEFRGVSFLWLPDISLMDPYYILPVVMGASMFLLSWIGMKNQPPNPQAKMMGYIFPVMMTFLFLRFASGLNLYYAVQNFAAIPQQWMLTKERSKSATVATVRTAKA